LIESTSPILNHPNPKKKKPHRRGLGGRMVNIGKEQ
jgi:hypothetical protein